MHYVKHNNRLGRPVFNKLRRPGRPTMTSTPRALRRAALVLCAVLLATPAAAQALLRVGKSVPEAFSFVPLDVGMRNGLFKKYGVDIESSALGGGGRLQQAMAADGIDFGLGSGPEMAAIVKGSPVKVVASMAGAPR